MTKVVKRTSPSGTATGGQAGGGGLGDLLGGLLGGGGLGSILGNVVGGGAAGSGTVGSGAGSQTGGGLGGILGGGLGALIPTLLPAILGMLGGKASANQSGMHQIIDNMHANGLGDVAKSWVGGGPNQPITADQVPTILTSAQLAELSAKSGLPQDQVSAGVAAILPHVVNHLTPDGALPDAQQVQSKVGQLQQSLEGVAGPG